MLIDIHKLLTVSIFYDFAVNELPPMTVWSGAAIRRHPPDLLRPMIQRLSGFAPSVIRYTSLIALQHLQFNSYINRKYT
jgi:hypothetical protein